MNEKIFLNFSGKDALSNELVSVTFVYPTSPVGKYVRLSVS
jgi:hypothetical protein